MTTHQTEDGFDVDCEGCGETFNFNNTLSFDGLLLEFDVQGWYVEKKKVTTRQGSYYEYRHYCPTCSAAEGLL